MRYLILLLLSLSMDALTKGTQIYERSISAVVKIKSAEKTGAGVLVSKEGHLLTNYHVIKDTEKIEIFRHVSSDLDLVLEPFEILKMDKEKDLALLKLINSDTIYNFLNLSIVIPSIGSKTHAIGHPRGESWTYSLGYIAQKYENYIWRYKDGTRMIGNIYQIQNPIKKGNSGGPLLNEYGNLIGINTFISKGDEQMGYAISVKDIIEFLAK